MPHGTGSAVFRGRIWRICYRDPEGNIHYEGTVADAVEAQRILAERALPRARAMVAALEAIVDGRPYQDDAGARPAARPAKARRVSKAPRRDRAKARKGAAR